MTATDRDEGLRERYLKPAVGADRGSGCPPPETSLRVVLHELPAAARRAFADHAATCASCAVEWNLAREYVTEARLVAETRPARAGFGLRHWAAMAAAAATVAAMILFIPRTDEVPPESPVLRTVGPETVASLVDATVGLPADRFVLRWTPGPEGTRYDIRVTDRRLEPLAGARSLQQAEFLVPTEGLTDLESGSVVLWQVESILTDGSRVSSPTFSARLE